MVNKYLWLMVAGCAGPLSSHVCVNKTGKTDAPRLAPTIVSGLSGGGSFSVQVNNHAPALHDTARLETALRGELAGQGFTLRDEAECDHFLRVTLEKRQIYVEVVERKTRRVPYLHEYALDFCD